MQLLIKNPRLILGSALKQNEIIQTMQYSLKAIQNRFSFNESAEGNLRCISTHTTTSFFLHFNQIQLTIHYFRATQRNQKRFSTNFAVFSSTLILNSLKPFDTHLRHCQTRLYSLFPHKWVSNINIRPLSTYARFIIFLKASERGHI